jgi:hypothetical protein
LQRKKVAKEEATKILENIGQRVLKPFVGSLVCDVRDKLELALVIYSKRYLK